MAGAAYQLIVYTHRHQTCGCPHRLSPEAGRSGAQSHAFLSHLTTILSCSEPRGRTYARGGSSGTHT